MMRYFNLFVLAIIAIAAAAYAQPDTLWTRTFGAFSYDEGHDVQQTSDGGYIIAGRSQPFGSNDCVYLIKTDASGNQEWSQYFGGAVNKKGYSVQQTNDGGYIIAGMIYTNDGDVYLVKTDASGVEQWNQAFGGYYFEEGRCVQQTSDNGYIIAGHTFSYGAGDFDFYLIKTDASGNEVWSRTFGGSNDDYCYSVQQTSDGGYIVAGYTECYGAGGYDVWLIKTDTSGNELWNQTFGGSEGDYGHSVQQTSDGGYIITGYTYTYGSGSGDVYLIKTDASGTEQWDRTYGGISGDYGYSVQQIADGGYIIAGYTYSFGAGSSDVYLIKTDSSGAGQWGQTFGGSGDDWGYSVQQTDDDGYIITGFTSSYGAGSTDVYLIRVEAEPVYPDFIVDLTYISGSPVPPGGGLLYFDIYLSNNSGEAQDFDAWLDVEYEGAVPTTVVLRALTNYLPGWAINRPDSWFPVPAGYAAGDYRMWGRCGDNPDIVWAEDGFNFEKSGVSDGLAFAPFIPDCEFPDPFDEIITGKPGQDIPAEYRLLRCYPNPFNPSTMIRFEMPIAGDVQLYIYDIQGNVIATLTDGWQMPGSYQVPFNAAHLSSGIYFARLTTGDYQQTQKLVLLK